MKKFTTLMGISALAFMIGHIDANAARVEKLKTKDSTKTQTKERVELNTVRPDVSAKKDAAGQRTEVRQDSTARARTVETKSSKANAAGAMCSVEQLAGRNTGDAFRAGVITAGACATNFGEGEGTLTEEAKGVVADLGIEGLAELRRLGTSLDRASSEQLAATSASMVKKFATLRNISTDEAASRLIQICGQCHTFAPALCSESTVAQASQMISRR
jgi:hypothetical protein